MKIDPMTESERAALLELWRDVPECGPEHFAWTGNAWERRHAPASADYFDDDLATLIAEAALVRWLLGKTGRAESRSPEVDDGVWTVSMGIGVLGVGSSYLVALIAAVRAVANKPAKP